MFVIGVAGQAQNGKDTLADRLKLTLNERIGSEFWARAAFAKNVKKVYADTFGVDFDFIEEWKVKTEIPPGFDKNVRQSLQFIGDGFRQIKSTIWLDLAFRNKDVASIISDVRYINEFVRVHDEGGLGILVGRPDKLNDDPNGSEAEIRPYVDWFLKNTTGNFVKVEEVSLEGAPPHSDKFHLFVQNSGTKDELYDIVDNQIVEFVQNFVFDFTKE